MNARRALFSEKAMFSPNDAVDNEVLHALVLLILDSLAHLFDFSTGWIWPLAQH